MISNVALKATDANGSATPSVGEAGDTGVFDALLALHDLITADAATAVGAPLAGTLEGADLLADTLSDSTEDATEQPTEENAEAEGGLWLLAAPLPALKVPLPTATVEPAVAAPVRHEASPAVAPPQAAAPDTASDLVQAFAAGAADAQAGNPQSALSGNPVTPVIDTTTWNSLTGPAELFAQSTRARTAERAESSPLTTHVRDPRWADELGNRLASMVRTGDSSASLQMTPPDLGPLEVNVAVRDNQATVHFGAANAETRALLEASMPRLREMLAAQGFQLMDSSVSHGFARQTRHEAAGTPRVDGVGEAPTHSEQAIRITGLLDLYA